MKEKILNEINNFANMCYVTCKFGAGDYAKEKFPTFVENFYDENRSDKENFKAIKNMFELNIVFNQHSGNFKAAAIIETFLNGWYNKIKYEDD